jgi:hypothetical protein
MIARIVLAVVVGVVTTLACMLIGAILAGLPVPIAATVGNFLATYAAAFGVLAALWYFFSGGFVWPRPA